MIGLKSSAGNSSTMVTEETEDATVLSNSSSQLGITMNSFDSTFIEKLQKSNNFSDLASLFPRTSLDNIKLKKKNKSKIIPESSSTLKNNGLTNSVSEILDLKEPSKICEMTNKTVDMELTCEDTCLSFVSNLSRSLNDSKEFMSKRRKNLKRKIPNDVAFPPRNSNRRKNCKEKDMRRKSESNYILEKDEESNLELTCLSDITNSFSAREMLSSVTVYNNKAKIFPGPNENMRKLCAKDKEEGKEDSKKVNEDDMKISMQTYKSKRSDISSIITTQISCTVQNFEYEADISDCTATERIKLNKGKEETSKVVAEKIFPLTGEVANDIVDVIENHKIYNDDRSHSFRLNSISFKKMPNGDLGGGTGIEDKEEEDDVLGKNTVNENELKKRKLNEMDVKKFENSTENIIKSGKRKLYHHCSPFKKQSIDTDEHIFIFPEPPRKRSYIRKSSNKKRVYSKENTHEEISLETSETPKENPQRKYVRRLSKNRASKNMTLVETFDLSVNFDSSSQCSIPLNQKSSKDLSTSYSYLNSPKKKNNASFRRAESLKIEENPISIQSTNEEVEPMDLCSKNQLIKNSITKSSAINSKQISPKSEKLLNLRRSLRKCSRSSIPESNLNVNEIDTTVFSSVSSTNNFKRNKNCSTVLNINQNNSTLSSDCTLLKKAKIYYKKAQKSSGQKIIKKSSIKRKNIKNNKVLILENKIYKTPKLVVPATWVSKKLYNFLKVKLEPQFGLEARIKSEIIVSHLAGTVNTCVFVSDDFSSINETLNLLRNILYSSNICVNYLEFYSFVYYFTPFDFSLKILPLCGLFKSFKEETSNNLFESIVHPD